MFIVHFLLLLIPLVFFHELGHFLVARWMGVRVLSFSVGMGPVVWSTKRGDTEYALRALPLGGYVRMHGDDPTGGDDEGPPDADAFTAKPVWRRSLIVAAGPVANLILPVVILFSGSLINDAEVPSSRVGTVLPGGAAHAAGLRSGDRLLAIDGVPIETYADLLREISIRPGQRVVVRVERDGDEKALTVTPEPYRDMRLPELGIIDTVGRIGVVANSQASFVQVEPGSVAARAGLRTGDRVLSIDGVPTTRHFEVTRALAAAAGREVTLEVAPYRHRAALSKDALKKHDGVLHDTSRKRVVRLVADRAEALGIAAAQLVVGVVEAGSPADKAGLAAGDQILSLDGEPIGSFHALVDALQRPYNEVRAKPEVRSADADAMVAALRAAVATPRSLRVRRSAADASPPGKAASVELDAVRELDVALKLEVAVDGTGTPSLRIGMGPLQRAEPPERIANSRRLAYAAAWTADQMGQALEVTLTATIGLFRGQVPIKEVGGPIFMAQLATKTAEEGWGSFFFLMVMLSVNLAIINLLPIPIADGGQLLFLAIEAVRREPVSVRTRMVAAYIGLTFLALLFVVVMKNDVQRLIASFGN